MKTTLILIVLLIVVSVATAAQKPDIVCVADTTIQFTLSSAESGPPSIDIAVEGGTGSIRMFWFKPGLRPTVKSSELYFLDSTYPPRHLTFTVGPDSADVDKNTFTRIIITPSK